MKRGLLLLGAVCLTAVITFLAVSKHLAEERAARLDQALMEAEARVMALEDEIEAAKQSVAELNISQDALRAQLAARHSPASASSQSLSVPTEHAIPDVNSASSPTTGVQTVAGGVIVPVVGMVEPWLRYAATAAPGVSNFVRIEGTSSLHDWQVEGHLIGGSAEFEPGFPPAPGPELDPARLGARATLFIPVRSLKSVDPNGKHYSNTMDEVMYDKVRADTCPRLTFTLATLDLIHPPPKRGSPLVCQATGNLVVAGATNTVSFPVTVTPSANGRIQFAGSAQVKMSDFGIRPPSPNFAGVSITTGDPVTLKFQWWVNRVAALEAAK